jgi:hypothetical protein
MVSSSSKINAPVLELRHKRLVEMFMYGRAHGLAAARNAIEQAQRELADAHADRERLQDKLDRALHRYEIAKSIIERADAIEAMRERADDPNGITLH